MLSRLDIPYDARGLMSLPWRRRFHIGAHQLLARLTRAWRHPVDIPIDINDARFWAYWLHKSARPIVIPWPDSGLDKHFRRDPWSDFPGRLEEFLVQSTLRLSAVGDLMCTPGLSDSRDQLYEEVADLIFGGDIAFANLESTLTTGDIEATSLSCGETPRVNASAAQYEAFIQHRGRSFDLVQTANNHILDCGEEGLDATHSRLRMDGIQWSGTNESEHESEMGTIIERNGLRIGWVSFTFSVNFQPFPAGKKYLVNLVPFHIEPEPDTSLIKRQLAWCRAQKCDFVVLSLHWGLEFELFPHPQQLSWAREFAEAGADLIIGHHPHVIQRAEVYRTKRDPDRLVPIVYSLGNLTPMCAHPITALSAVANFELVKGSSANGAVTYVAACELTPVILLRKRCAVRSTVCLKPLAGITLSEVDAETCRYLNDASEYADLSLGCAWRNRTCEIRSRSQ